MSSGNGQAEARVQVLTAEVRTLVVGSRQVTLSVYNQLDFVPHDQIEPFGRVNPKDAMIGTVYIVGRDSRDGVLVRASSPKISDFFDEEPYQNAALQAVNCAIAHIADLKMVDDIEERRRQREPALIACGRLSGRFDFDADRIIDIIDRLPGPRDRNWVVGVIKEHFRGERPWCSDYVAPDRTEPEYLTAAKVLDEVVAERDACGRRVAEIRAAWENLPLIVLAGLR